MTPRGGDQTEQKAKGGIEHIAEAAAGSENGQTNQTETDVERLRERAEPRAEQQSGHGGEEALQRDGRVHELEVEERADGGQGGKQGAVNEVSCFHEAAFLFLNRMGPV